jgi:putative ABC transport system permease protein
MLKRFHKKKDYIISIPLALLKQAEATKRTFNIVLGSIAGISLLVGGIGIMNIMLASVTERTREIGIRRALGAKRKQIIIQFLIETVVLSTIGGIVGIGLGIFIPILITYFAGMPTVITPWSIVLPLCISVSIGIIFGLYPAARAAEVDPIVALRHE